MDNRHIWDAAREYTEGLVDEVRSGARSASDAIKASHTEEKLILSQANRSVGKSDDGDPWLLAAMGCFVSVRIVEIPTAHDDFRRLWDVEVREDDFVSDT